MERSRQVLVWVIVLLVGCVGAPAPESATVSDSAGVRIIAHASLDGPLVQLPDQPLLRVGWQADHPHFDEISAGALLGDGSSAVFDQGLSTLYLVAADGSRTTPVGRSGEGPGEFQDGSSVEALAGDTVLVYDQRLARLSYFDAGGTLVESRPRAMLGRVSSRPVSATSSNRLAWIPFAVFPDPTLGPGLHWVTGPVLTSTLRGLDDDTVATVPLLQLRIGDGSISIDAFAASGAVDAHPDGFVWAQSDVPELRWASPMGDLQQITRWIATPEPVDDAAWARLDMALRDRVMAGPERPSEEQFAEILRDQRRNASATLPLFSRLHAALDGAVWLSEWVPLEEPPQTYLMFGGDGVFRGRMVFPRPIRILDLGATRVLGVEMDELGVEAVVVYDLPG